MSNNTPSSNNESSTGFYIGVAILGIIGALGLFMVIYAVGVTLRDRLSVPNATQTNAPTQISVVTTAPQQSVPTKVIEPTTPATQSQPPSATQPPAQPTPSGPMIKVSTAGVIRSGPGFNYEVLGSMAVGEIYPILGRTQDGAWVAIQYSPTRIVWVSATLVQIENGVIGGIPVRNTPIPPATATPIPPTPIPATLTPAFTATSAIPIASSSRGVRGDSFSVRSTSVGINDDIWFDFKVTNTTDQTLAFKGLGAVALNKQGKPSWGDATLGPHQVLEWSDHINILSAGTYTIYLGICWEGSRSGCEQSGSTGTWTLLSQGYTVVVK